jgi:ATP-dependent Zn protease
MSELIDEYQSISKAMEDSCMQMLLENRDMLEKLAETLIERETMDENDLIKLFENMKKEDLSNETNEKTVGSTISVPDGYDFDVGM